MSVRTLIQVGIGLAQRRALAAPQVAALKKDGQRWVAPSLYLNLKEGQGTRSWLFRYRRNGINQWIGLGSVEEKSLSCPWGFGERRSLANGRIEASDVVLGLGPLRARADIGRECEP